MKKLVRSTKQFFSNVDGATAIEYGLIAAGISIVIVVVVFALGDQLDATFSTINSALAGAGGT
ncbi:MAG: Flp family type IVb pilin [Magnetospiraceae bacterium]